MTDRETIIKRLIYQSVHRGCKETDFIFSRYVPENISNFSDEELLWFDLFLKESDWDIYDWMTGKVALPKEHQNRITEALKNFSLS